MGFLKVAGGEDFAIEAAELGDVWRSEWRWIIEEVAEDPRAALDG